MYRFFSRLSAKKVWSITSVLLICASCSFSQSHQKFVTKNHQIIAMDHRNNPYYSRTDTTTLHVSDAEWKKILPPEVYRVARERGTEPPFQNRFWNFSGKGTYYCAVCGNALFRSDAKFASSCGWPSFFEPVRKNSVIYRPDHSYGMERTEVICARCGSHLGHVFEDGPPPTGLRYCMNSIVLDFVPDSTAR
ncbi:MAG: peptide-methionine (R)-S-oxide reductase MsrB [Thermoflavifilum sp.]|nr:peptide-methionine (R)-S-oxide reductase MsrB [Thermoflavifilum sp.]